MAKHRFKGTKRLDRILATMPAAARAELKKSLTLSARDLVKAQRALVPVRTGALKKSIGWSENAALLPKHAAFGGAARRQASDLSVVVFAGNSGVRYAHLVEFGSVHAGAKPFFYPAYRLRKRQIRQRARRAVRAAVKKAREAAGT